MRKQWQDSFTTYTGQWAFSLSLSRTMIAMLGWYRDNDFSVSLNHESRLSVPTSRFITAGHALERRGLVERIAREPYSYECPRTDNVAYFETRLTPAGRSVCELLVMAGLLAKPRVKLALTGEMKK